MLNYSIFADNKDVTEQFSKYSKVVGAIFVAMGLLGIFFPAIMSLTSALFIGWLMLFSAFLVAFQTWKVNKKDWWGWLKALMFLIVGVLIFINPLTGVVALGILFTAYFLVDSFINFSLAFSIKPNSMWWIALLNGILSLAIGIYFFIAIADPLKTLWLVGIFVGISLFFDGVMLWSLGSAADKKA